MVKRVLLFVTSHNSTNGYSYVGYEIAKRLSTYADIHLTVFGFQNFHKVANHRLDYPDNVYEYDAFANETVKQGGFGVEQVKDFVTANRPDVCIVYNDAMILHAVITQLKAAQEVVDRPFKIVAYVDQVYLCQKREYIDFLNKNTDFILAFTPFWEKCLLGQGITLPTRILRHGFNAQIHYPIPQKLARRLFGLSADDFIVMNLNRNQPRKRWDICMQAWALVVKQLLGKPIKLMIGTSLQGAWNILEVFERELAKLGLTLEQGMKHVIALDFPQQLCDEDVNFLYNVADIGLNTCDGEGFGLCNFQQAAIGIPQVVTAVGGFLDFFDDTCAITVKPKLTYYVDNSRDSVGGEAELGDYRDFAAGIVKYFEDRALVAEHGKRGREKILKNYGWDGIVKDLRGYIYEALQEQVPVESEVQAEEEEEVASDIGDSDTNVDINALTKVRSHSTKNKSKVAKGKKDDKKRLLKERLAAGSVYNSFKR